MRFTKDVVVPQDNSGVARPDELANSKLECLGSPLEFWHGTETTFSYTPTGSEQNAAVPLRDKVPSRHEIFRFWQKTYMNLIGSRVGNYRVVDFIDAGGMGAVYLAEHLYLDRTVALKMVLHGGVATKEGLARFQVEAQAVARLAHPNIVQLFEFGELGKYYTDSELETHPGSKA